MFGLFQSFFGFERAGRYPESLVNKAIERAVDGTDPLLRGLFNYKRKLRPVVLTAMDHAIGMVDEFEPAIELSAFSCDSDPRLRTFFVSSKHMQEVFSADPELKEFVVHTGPGTRRVTALLVMEKGEKGIFGADRVGDVIVHDVPQVTVSFSNHLFRDPGDDLSETRRMMKRRAFDHLLTLALANISMAGERRADLARRHKLLQSKADLLNRGNWGFNHSGESRLPDLATIHSQLEGIEEELVRLGGDESVFEMNLGLVCDILGEPQRWLWAEKVDLIVDDMGIKRSQASSVTNSLTLDQISNAHGRQVVAAQVTFPIELLRKL